MNIQMQTQSMMEINILKQLKKGSADRGLNCLDLMSDPIGGLAWAEKYFKIPNTRPEMKGALAFVTMDGGSVVHWFYHFSI